MDFGDDFGNEVIMKENYHPQKPTLVKYLIVGQVFELYEKYEPIAAIGQGAYGIVVSAEDKELQEKAAVKKVLDVFGHVGSSCLSC
jgi:hypothetical protein